MNVFIVTLGSRGDVQPYVALGVGLQAAGHRVTLCTSASFEPFITGHGLEYGYMSDEFIQLVDSQTGREAMEEGGSVFGLVKAMARMQKRVKELNREMMREAWQAARAAGPGLVVYHPKALAGPHIAEKLGVPAVLAVPVPVIVPTAELTAAGFPYLKLGRGYNRLSYAVVHWGHRTYRGVIDEFRRETLGIGSMPKSAGPLEMADGTPIPVLHAYSELVSPRPKDWPDNAHITGYWFLDEEAGWQPPDDLAAFLRAGEPPVYAGFGSMAGRSPQKMAELVIEALQQAGVRGILATGWGGLEAGSLPDTIFKLESAPHSWLFPQTAAVVHHGGAGTTAAGLRAGRPTVVCPFLIDQPYWGERVYELGVGSKPIPQKKLTADKLAAAIREVTSSPEIRVNAEALGRQLRAEDGVGNAVALLERIAGARAGGESIR